MASHIEFKLPAEGIAANDNFGTSVAVDGDVIVVCAKGSDDPSQGSRRAAYFYKRSGLAWVQQARLSQSDPMFFDEFGTSVSISGNYAMVGAPMAGASPHGQVYVVRRDGETWQEHATLTPSNDEPFQRFGQAVAISGDYAVVGADSAAYVFQRDGTVWTQAATLDPGHIERAGFGRAVAIDGDTVVIGHWAASGQTAMVHVFQREGSTWTPQAHFPSGDPKQSGYFGWSVDIDGDRIVVGDFDADTGNTNEPGKAYVFERTGNAWSMAAALEPESPHAVNQFGWAVGISGDLVVVGDDSDFSVQTGAGAAYVFRRENGTWSLAVPKILASDAAHGAHFGYSVAIDAGTVVIGARDDSDPGFPYKGSAYVCTGFHDADLLHMNVDKWRIYAVILWGLTQGGGGFTIFPGGTGGPVDPEPFKAWRRMSPVVRDMYLSTLIGEVARQLGNPRGKAEIQAAALRLRKTLELELEREQKK